MDDQSRTIRKLLSAPFYRKLSTDKLLPTLMEMLREAEILPSSGPIKLSHLLSINDFFDHCRTERVFAEGTHIDLYTRVSAFANETYISQQKSAPRTPPQTLALPLPGGPAAFPPLPQTLKEEPPSSVQTSLPTSAATFSSTETKTAGKVSMKAAPESTTAPGQSDAFATLISVASTIADQKPTAKSEKRKIETVQKDSATQKRTKVECGSSHATPPTKRQHHAPEKRETRSRSAGTRKKTESASDGEGGPSRSFGSVLETVAFAMKQLKRVVKPSEVLEYILKHNLRSNISDIIVMNCLVANSSQKKKIFVDFDTGFALKEHVDKGIVSPPSKRGAQQATLAVADSEEHSKSESK